MSNWGKTKPQVSKEVSERWRKKCRGLGDAAGDGPLLQLYGRLSANVSANVYQNLLQQHAVPPSHTHTHVYI